MLTENGLLNVHLSRKPLATSVVPAQLEQTHKESWELLDAAPTQASPKSNESSRATGRELTDDEEFLLTARLRDFSSSQWVRPPQSVIVLTPQVYERLIKLGAVSSDESMSRVKRLFSRFKKDIFKDNQGLLASAVSFLRLSPGGMHEILFT